MNSHIPYCLCWEFILAFAFLIICLLSSHSHLQLSQRQFFCQMFITCGVGIHLLQPRASLLRFILAFVFTTLFWSIPVIIKFKPGHVFHGFMACTEYLVLFGLRSPINKIAKFHLMCFLSIPNLFIKSSTLSGSSSYLLRALGQGTDDRKTVSICEKCPAAEIKCRHLKFKQIFRFWKILSSSVKSEDSEENVTFYDGNIHSKSVPEVLTKGLKILKK